MSSQPPHSTRFQPGNRANPNGRPLASVKLQKLLAAETQDGIEIVKTVLGIVRGKDRKCKSEASKRWALDWCSDRLWGKSKQVIEMEPGTGQPQADYSALSDSDLSELERIMTKTITVGDQPDPALGVPGEIIPVEPGTSSDPE